MGHSVLCLTNKYFYNNNNNNHVCKQIKPFKIN